MGDKPKRCVHWNLPRDSSSSSSSSSNDSVSSSDSSSTTDPEPSFRPRRCIVSYTTVSSSSPSSLDSNEPSTSTGRRGGCGRIPISKNSRVGPPIKRVKYVAVEDASSTTTEPYHCPVCLEDVRRNAPVSTTCGHIFCKRCFLRVLSATSKCPMCGIYSPEYHRVYM